MNKKHDFYHTRCQKNEISVRKIPKINDFGKEENVVKNYTKYF